MEAVTIYSFSTCESVYPSSPRIPATGPCERSRARGPATVAIILRNSSASFSPPRKHLTHPSGPHTTTSIRFSCRPGPIHFSSVFFCTRPVTSSELDFAPLSGRSTR